MFPEISVNDLGAKLRTEEKFILLDVCEPFELGYAKIDDPRLETAPISQLSQVGTDALSEAVRAQDVPVYVICHHGSRSSQVTAWLAQQGWKNVFNVRGGIDEYARKVDALVGSY